MALPVVNQPTHRSGALLDYFARRMRVRTEAVLAPMGLRPRHLVALTVLRVRGDSTQQALATTLAMDGTNIVGLLNELEAEKQRETLYHLLQLAATGTGACCPRGMPE
jgi:hypothetical protein